MDEDFKYWCAMCNEPDPKGRWCVVSRLGGEEIAVCDPCAMEIVRLWMFEPTVREAVAKARNKEDEDAGDSG